MIAVRPKDEPNDFDERVRQPGKQWLTDHPDAKRPYPYWSIVMPALADAFSDLCAYSAMYLPTGTVDHFISCSTNRDLAYEWSNYRLAAGWVNSSKRALDSGILDPFDVEDGWFEIILPSLQLRVAESVPDTHRELAEATLKKLHLRDDERVLRQRRMWHRMYVEGKVSLAGLHRMAPLIARAVERGQAATT